MAKVGTRATALKIYKHFLEHSNGDGYASPRLPKGISGSDEGGLRQVFFDKNNGVVYKVDFEWTIKYEETYANRMELNNARYLRKKYPDGIVGEHVRIPACSGYTFDGRLVVAMEYVRGRIGMEIFYDRPRVWKRIEPARKELFKLGFRDMHSNNWIVDKEDKIWPIDLGSPRSWKHADYEPPDDAPLWKYGDEDY